MKTLFLRFLKLSLLLCALMPCLIFSVNADDVTSGSCGENATWSYDSATQTVTISGSGAMSDYDGTDARWGRYYSAIRRVIIGDGITHICKDAFRDYVKIVDITFLGNMPTFGDNCFAHISASAWYNPNNSTWTFPVPGNHAATDLFFQKSGKEGTHCGENATWKYDAATATLTIDGSGAMYEFYDEARQPWASFREQVQYVVIGENITHIGWNAFSYMTGLKNIRCTGDMPSFSYNTVVNVKVPGSYPDGNNTWDLTTTQKGSTNGWITWSVHQGYSGTCGGNTAWSFDPLTGVLTISGSGRMNAYEQWENPWRFHNDSITKVVVKGTVEHIGDFAFFRLFNVTEIVIEDGVQSVGRNALQNTKIASITLPDSIVSMGMVALGSSHNLTTLTLPDKLQKISNLIFTDCPALKSIYVGSQVTEVENSGLGNLQDTSIFFTGNAPTFHEESFRLTSGIIYYPNNDPTWTKAIQQTYGATALTWIPYDPNNSDSIPEDGSNPGGNTPTLGNGWTYFGETGELIIYPGCNTQEVYATITGGQLEPVRSVIIEGGFTHIPVAMFAGMSYLETVQLCDGITAIDENAFADCTALRAISLPEGLTTIEMGAFINAAALESITFPTTVDNIGDGAFELCTALTDIQFTGNAPSIGENAFSNVCASVTYPEMNETWADIVGHQFGGVLTWPVSTSKDILEQIQNAETGSCIKLSDSVLTGELLAAAKGKDIDIVLSTEDYQWTINGKDIADAAISAVDMRVSLNTQSIPADIIEKLSENFPVIQFSLVHNGEFGFDAELRIAIDPAYAGKTGRLYYYTGSELTPICSAIVAADGSIALPFSHASDYALVIEDTHSRNWLWWLVIPAAGAIAGAVFLLMRKKKSIS